MHSLKMKNAYEKPVKSDGFRILVDRVWPEGLTQDTAQIDLWLKEVAPSITLQQWFARNANKSKEFRQRYAKELQNKPVLLGIILQHAQEQSIVLISAMDNTENHQVAILCSQLQLQLLKQLS